MKRSFGTGQGFLALGLASVSLTRPRWAGHLGRRRADATDADHTDLLVGWQYGPGQVCRARAEAAWLGEGVFGCCRDDVGPGLAQG